MKTRSLLVHDEEGNFVEHPYVECWFNPEGETVDFVINWEKFKKATEDWDYSI